MHVAMVFSFDGMLMLAYGLFSLICGILNKGGLLWLSIKEHNPANPEIIRLINIIMGLLFIAMGAGLMNKT